MDKFSVSGGKPLSGKVTISGAKNVALKICVVSLLTDDPVVIENVPDIKDLHLMLSLLKSFGVDSKFDNHILELSTEFKDNYSIPLDVAARMRTSTLVLGPVLARCGRVAVPNPGGCRIGARPIDMHINALTKMGAKIEYNSDDGFFYATADQLNGTDITFEKNTHTGTEAVILAAVKAKGITTINNAAAEVEIDDLINCLNRMGAKIKRLPGRRIVVEGVTELHGTRYRIMGDRNEEVTYAVAAAITGGTVEVIGSVHEYLSAFNDAFLRAGGKIEQVSGEITRYSLAGHIKPINLTTAPHPGFMTDWQGPMAVLLTQASGESSVHETVFENRFSYVSQLQKMGADIGFYNPEVDDPEKTYNFHWHKDHQNQAIRICGPTPLHNAVLEMQDLRAGATLLLAALQAKGESQILGVDQIDRGYEHIEEKLMDLGANIKRIKEEL